MVKQVLKLLLVTSLKILLLLEEVPVVVLVNGGVLFTRLLSLHCRVIVLVHYLESLLSVSVIVIRHIRLRHRALSHHHGRMNHLDRNASLILHIGRGREGVTALYYHGDTVRDELRLLHGLGVLLKVV